MKPNDKKPPFPFPLFLSGAYDKINNSDRVSLHLQLVKNTNNMVTLFTRPRRFGKTLMMSMMENFFSIRKDSKAIFEELFSLRDARN